EVVVVALHDVPSAPQDARDLVFGVVDAIARHGRREDHRDAIGADHAARERRVWHEDDVVLIDAEGRRTLRLEGADDPAARVARAELRADRIASDEERVLHGGADDANLRADAIVLLRDAAARLRVPVADLEILGARADHRRRAIARAGDDVERAAAH